LGYGVAEGLPEATVRAILEDRRGALWLATAGGGVVRFDGARFEVYSEDSGLASNRIAALAEDGTATCGWPPIRASPSGA